jgi:MFS family permease
MNRTSHAIGRWAWIAMMIGVGVEFALGVACLALLPFRRPDQWLPPQSKVVYSAHAALGGVLTIAAVAIVMTMASNQRFVRLGAQAGLAGLLLGAAGGTLCAWHPWRVTGMGLMFVGSLIAFSGYLIPLAEPQPDTPAPQGPARAEAPPVEW